ncbi:MULTISPECIES: hypothetical protein [Sphingomonas]|jgi:hypothetical protein|uniref:Uncharacterized protein n=1 Tax=Sphingomonas echinoides TaxID=59803 RepID=A0ABU4PMF2_9SPHN|nr:hypothetical protein [Sphingomonas echinoides]MDX5984293.1 hypothetical protein [Sphingomonas echinoides]
MPQDTKLIDEKALDSLSIAPGSPEENEQIHHPRQNAGQDESIAKRLERDPTSPDAVLDSALDESMDASDPPATTKPGDNGQPPKSSGYDQDAEAAIIADRR